MRGFSLYSMTAKGGVCRGGFFWGSFFHVSESFISIYIYILVANAVPQHCIRLYVLN